MPKNCIIIIIIIIGRTQASNLEIHCAIAPRCIAILVLLLTVLKLGDSKKAFPRSCPVFLKLVLNFQVRATHGWMFKRKKMTYF